jgi:pyruvate/2-oxoglutarate dehydrogenase complex dihydrolipoamide acyltransferase (E2) component
MPEPSPVLVPRMNVNDDHAVIVAWHVPMGARVTTSQLIATLETTKAAFDVQADRDGFIAYTEPVKSIIAVGMPLAWISDDANTPILPIAGKDSAGTLSTETAGVSRFTRKALRRMRELGLQATDFQGTGRIDVADVEKTAVGRMRSVQLCSDMRTSSHDDCEPIDESPSKLMEAMRLSETYRAVVPSLVAVPVSSEFVHAHLRNLAGAIGPITYLELVIREAASLLSDYPDLNGFFAEGRGWRYRQVSIGFAVNAGLGLRVPVVRRAAELSQLEVARAVRDLTLRYFRGELAMQDVTGGTFTVTDLSEQGVTNFIPVINERQAAIVGLCAERPGTGHRDVVLCFDHRISDGTRGGAFLGELRQRLERAEPGS